MKAVLIFGSPHENGFTRRLADMYINIFCEGYDVVEFSAYEMNVEPCRGCGACASGGSCVFRDMDGLIAAIAASELVIFASPVYYLSFPAPLKAVLDRFQPLYEAGRIGRNPLSEKHRRAVVLLTGGTPSERGEVIRAQLRWVLPSLGAELEKMIVIPNTDRVSPEEFERKAAEAVEN